MAADERISDFIDLAAIERQKKAMITAMDELLEKFNQLKGFRLTLEGAKSSVEVVKGVKQLSDGMTELSKKQAEAKKSVSDLSLATIEYQKVVNQNATLQAKSNASTSEAAKQNAILKLQTQEQNKALKDQAKEALGLTDAYGKLEKQYNEAARAAKNIAAEKGSDSSEAKAASAKANALSQQLKTIDAGVGQYQRNVGNYTGAIGILEKALGEVSQKIDQFGKSGSNNTQQLEKLKKEQDFLQQVLNKNAQGFASLTMEVRSNERALATMFAEGMKNTEAYKALEQQVSNAKRELGEFKEQQKILASQTPAIAAATLAAKGLAGAYAVGAGATALFGDEEGKVAKELEKLVAVMTVLQGLQEVHELLEKKGTIAKVASNIATQAQVIWQRVLSATMLQSAVASTVLRVGLISLSGGVLLLLPLIAAGATAVKKYNEKQEEAKFKTESLNEINKKAAETIADQSVKLQVLKDNFLKAGASAKEKTEITRELNKEFGDYGVHLNTVNDAEQFLVSKSKAFTEMLDLKAKATAAFSLATEEYKKSLESQTKADEEYLDTTDAVIVKLKNTFSDFFSSNGAALANDATDAVKLAEEKKKKEVDTANKKYGILKAMGEKFQEESKTLSKENGFDLNNEQLADQLKVTQELSKLEIQTIIDKNNRVIASDKTTYEEKTRLLRDNADLQKRLAKVDLNAVENDPNRSNADKLIAQRKYAYDTKKIDADLNQTLIKQKQDYNNKQLQLNYEIIKERIDQEAKAQQDIADNSNNSVDVRLAAQQKFADKQKALIEGEYNYQKQLLQQKASTTEEYVLLEAQKDAKLVELAAGTEQKTIEILKHGYDKKHKLQEEELAAIERQLSNLQNSGTQQYAKDVVALNESLKRKEISIDAYNEKRKQLDRNYSKAALQNTIEGLQQEIAALDKNGIERVGIEQKIKTTEDALKAATTDQDKKALQDKLDLLNQELKDNESNATKLIDIKTNLENTKKQLSDDATQHEIENRQKVHELEKQLAQETFNLIQNVVLGGFDAKKNAIQQEIDQVDKQKQSEIDAINAQALSAEEKAARITLAEKKAAAEKDKLEKKQKEEDRKKAIAERAFQIFTIVGNTAMAVTKALSEGNPVAAALYGVIGAVEIATVLAQPIPKFKHGRQDGPATLAVVGDGGKAEVIEYANGHTALTPAVDTLTFLPEHAKVYPDVESYQRSSMAASLKTPVTFDKTLSDSKRYMQEMTERMERSNDKVVKAVQNIPGLSVNNTWSGMSVMKKRLDGWDDYLNENVRT